MSQKMSSKYGHLENLGTCLKSIRNTKYKNHILNAVIFACLSCRKCNLGAGQYMPPVR